MEIILAENYGFCYGVKRAVEMADEAANSEGKNRSWIGFFFARLLQPSLPTRFISPWIPPLLWCVDCLRLRLFSRI